MLSPFQNFRTRIYSSPFPQTYRASSPPPLLTYTERSKKGKRESRYLNLPGGGDRFLVGAVRWGDGTCLALGLLEGHLDVAPGRDEGVDDGEEEHGDCVEDILPVLHPECVSSSSLNFLWFMVTFFSSFPGEGGDG